MKASETSLRNLLEGTKQFQIPLFQRPYSWKEKNWNALWEDLMSLYNEEVKGFYFLGPIVTQSVPGTAEGISPFIVIDGQQRLTTLTILLAALRNYLKNKQENKSRLLLRAGYPRLCLQLRSIAIKNPTIQTPLSVTLLIRSPLLPMGRF